MYYIGPSKINLKKLFLKLKYYKKLNVGAHFKFSSKSLIVYM